MADTGDGGGEAQPASAPDPPDPSDPSGQVGTGRYRRVWLVFLLGGIPGVVGYQLTPTGIWRDLVYLAFGLAGALAIVVGVRLNRPARTMPWYLMAAGQLVWVIGDAVGSWDADVAHNERFPSPADAFYLAAYPVLAAGLLLLIRGRRRGRDVAGLLDSATVTVGLGLLSWVLLAHPTIANSEQSVAVAAVGVAYPVADILLLGLLITLISTPGGRTPSLRLLMTAVALLITSDTAASAQGLLTFDSTGAIDFIWLASYIVWGASALHPSMYSLSEPTSALDIRFRRGRLIALTFAVMVAPGTLAIQQLRGVSLDVWAVVVGSVVIFLLVVARMNVAIDQIWTANRQREEAQEELAHQALHDSLTGLPNRAHAIRSIQGALSRAQRSGAVVGLLFVDVDGFKTINDTLGHVVGDVVLRTVAFRLSSETRPGDITARLGGDEFVVLLEPLDEEASAVRVADRLVAAVSAPITLSDGRQVRVGASIGVAISQDLATDPEVLLHEADVALYRAKAAGRGRTEVFDSSLRRELDLRAHLEADIAAAIGNDELTLHYQPIFRLATGEVEGYEALVRWRRPGAGLLLPAEFIPVAERSDLICDLDAWVLTRATQQLAAWNRSTGSRDLVMAVNISGRHAARARIGDDVDAALGASGIAARQLVLEITETALFDDPMVVTNLEALRRKGVSISIDDFGTGYSSIARLESLPANILKIDKRFLDGSTPSADKLLRLIVQAAHALGLPVVAEGVEHDDQLAVLKAIGCESAQGYLLGRPVDQAEIDPRTRRPTLTPGLLT